MSNVMTPPPDERIDKLISLMISWITMDYTHRGDLPRDRMGEILNELMELKNESHETNFPNKEVREQGSS